MIILNPPTFFDINEIEFPGEPAVDEKGAEYQNLLVSFCCVLLSISLLFLLLFVFVFWLLFSSGFNPSVINTENMLFCSIFVFPACLCSLCWLYSLLLLWLCRFVSPSSCLCICHSVSSHIAVYYGASACPALCVPWFQADIYGIYTPVVCGTPSFCPRVPSHWTGDYFVCVFSAQTLPLYNQILLASGCPFALDCIQLGTCFIDLLQSISPLGVMDS